MTSFHSPPLVPWEDDDPLEIRVRQEQALAALLEGAESLAVDVAGGATVTPLMSMRAVQVLQELANYNRLKKAHLRTVAG